MSFINKLEDNLSSAYVERKLDPLERPHAVAHEHHSPEEHASGEHYHGKSRLSDAFESLNNAIHVDTTHKTGEAFDEHDMDGMAIHLADPFVSLNNAIHGDTTHKTGEAFNDGEDVIAMHPMNAFATRGDATRKSGESFNDVMMT